ATTMALGLVACQPQSTRSPDGRGKSRRNAAPSPLKLERGQAAKGTETPALAILEQELAGNLAKLADEDDTPAYFIAYDLVTRDQLWLEAQGGTVLRNRHDRDRTIDIDVRVGSQELDNSHPLGGNYGPGNGLGIGLPVSVEDDPLSLAQALWMLTESQYRDAVDALSSAESEESLRSQGDEPRHPDFSTETPLVHVEPEADLDLDALAKSWESRLQAV
ncbi:MAG: hypothetical protein ACPG4T_24780, partial [Nannocystaceae bacterium]